MARPQRSSSNAVQLGFWPRYVLDYEHDTPHLTMLQHGVYTRMLDRSWSLGGPLPDDPVAVQRIIGATDEEIAAAWEAVRPFWSEAPRRPGWIIQQRLERERALAMKLAAAKSEGGLEGARKRWGKSGGRNGTPMADPLPTQSHTQRRPTGTPTGTPASSGSGSGIGSPMGDPSANPMQPIPRPGPDFQSGPVPGLGGTAEARAHEATPGPVPDRDRDLFELVVIAARDGSRATALAGLGAGRRAAALAGVEALGGWGCVSGSDRPPEGVPEVSSRGGVPAYLAFWEAALRAGDAGKPKHELAALRRRLDEQMREEARQSEARRRMVAEVRRQIAEHDERQGPPEAGS